jgi:hypothetical protein
MRGMIDQPLMKKVSPRSLRHLWYRGSIVWYPRPEEWESRCLDFSVPPLPQNFGTENENLPESYFILCFSVS